MKLKLLACIGCGITLLSSPGAEPQCYGIGLVPFKIILFFPSSLFPPLSRHKIQLQR